MPSLPQFRKLGFAWLMLCAALGLHVVDEAATGFLNVYNPTVLALRKQLPWFPAPTFTFGAWLGILIAAIVILLALTPFAFQGKRWMRAVAYIHAAIEIANALGHIAGTILGHTVSSVRFARPAPGFYSSPLLLAGAWYLLRQLRRVRRET